MVRRGRLFVAGVLACFCACTYDWPIGSPSDAGHDAPPDGSLVDRPAEADAPGDAPKDGGADTGPDGAVNCVALQDAAGTTRAAAKACAPLSQACFPTVKDECGCLSYVLVAGTPQDTNYAAAVKALNDSKCALACPPSCPSIGTSGLCLIVDASVQQCSP